MRLQQIQFPLNYRNNTTKFNLFLCIIQIFTHCCEDLSEKNAIFGKISELKQHY